MDRISKKKAVKKHKTSKKRKKLDASGEESVDMSEKIFPIAHYIDDREEMMKQVFSVMEKEKLNCMLPPILKGMTMSVLKDHCLRELRNMSGDEIRKVLCGEPLEATAGQASVPPQVDLDSGDSTSSVEECQNEDQDKRTLLDILEQEMQEIAYNTVLKTDVVSSVEGSEDELPEVVEIIPIDPPSKTKSNVPVICIDSGDEEPTSSSSPQKGILDRCKATNFTMTILADKVSKEKETISENKKQSDNDILVEDSSCNNQSKDSVDLSQTISQAQESFLIQVFPKTTSVVGRIVKKVYKSPGKSAAEGILANKDLQSHTNTECEAEAEGGENSEVEITHEDIVQSDDSISECELGVTPSNGVCETSALQFKEPCNEVHNSDAPDNHINEKISSEDTLQLQEAEEKEEGEISEEEFEEYVEVLEKARNSHRSPTISLSSDCSDRKSDSERSESRARVRRHRHGHRRSRRETDSPERSRRHIEKRGNRSYRRKTSSSVMKKCDKVEEASEENGRLEPSMCCMEMPVVALEDIELPPSKTSSQEAESKITASTESKVEISEDFEHLELEKEKNKEDVKVQEDLSHAPDKLNNVSDSKLDSSEDAEVSDGGEPVSSKTSWADRWAEKKDLKKVVITSKICRNVRKKILSARKKQTSQETSTIQTAVLPPVPPLVLHVEGSVKEYQMLQLLVGDTFDDEQGGSSTDAVKKFPNEEALDCHRNKQDIGNKTVGNINEADSAPATLKQVSEEHEVLDKI